MTIMHRRQFLGLGGLAAIAGAIGPAVAFPGRQETPRIASRTIRFDNDGLGLTPQEYSSLLNDVATDKGIAPDYYSLGGAVAEMEQKFAALLGKEGAVFMPTGTLANQIALRKLDGIALHLDGARLFNVPQHSGKSIIECSSLFDTVYVSLWKCFNAASGAVLAGSKNFTEGLFHLRRMFGGSLPQAWPSAAVAMRYADDYLKDYSRAWNVADEFLSALQKSDRVTIGRVANGTNAFHMALPGVTPVMFAERLLKRNIVLPQPQKDTGVFWMTVNTTLNGIRAGELAGAFLEASRP